MKYLFCWLLLLYFTGCTASDPNPERTDIIYIDLGKELDLTQKAIEQAEKDFEERKVALNNVIPQSGQQKALQKKVFESQNFIQKLLQQRQFFEIKMELRKNLVFSRYHESKKGGRAWPDIEEVKNYTGSIKLNRDKIGWDKNKGIVKDVPRGTTEKAKSDTEHKAEN